MNTAVKWGDQIQAGDVVRWDVPITHIYPDGRVSTYIATTITGTVTHVEPGLMTDSVSLHLTDVSGLVEPIDSEGLRFSFDRSHLVEVVDRKVAAR